MIWSIFLLLRLIYLELVLGKMEGLIVGGQETVIQKFPYSAFISVRCATFNEVYESWCCGASIIHQSFLLTAAHCFDNCQKHCTVTVAVGSEHWTKGYMYLVEKYLRHMNYDTVKVSNDIALAMLSKPLKLSAKVQPLRLPKSRPRNQTAFVAGWGMTDPITEENSEKIKYAKQTVFTKKYCSATIPDIPGGTLCAGNHKEMDYAAQGDSGSALTVRDSADKKQFKQIGIVSFKNMVVSLSKVVYTDIVYFYDWIQKRMKTMLEYISKKKRFHKRTK